MFKIKKAVIPAAGLGTRFLPITKAVPKPMLSVIDKPTVQYITEELQGVGIEEIVIVVSQGSDVIKKHFGPAPELEARLLADGKKALYDVERKTQAFNVKFVEQKEPDGLAGAILCAEPYIGNEPFALLLGDELLYAGKGETSCMQSLADIYEKTGKSVIATIEVFGEDVSKYGNVGVGSESDGVMEVNKIVEKPSVNEALSNNAVIGRYVMASGVMDIIKTLPKRKNEICFTEALEVLAERGELCAFSYEGRRYDVGDKLGFLKANVDFAVENEEIGEGVAEYIISVAEKLKKHN